jgi:hypothetical protein
MQVVPGGGKVPAESRSGRSVNISYSQIRFSVFNFSADRKPPNAANWELRTEN